MRAGQDITIIQTDFAQTYAGEQTRMDMYKETRFGNVKNEHRHQLLLTNLRQLGLSVRTVWHQSRLITCYMLNNGTVLTRWLLYLCSYLLSRITVNVE